MFDIETYMRLHQLVWGYIVIDAVNRKGVLSREYFLLFFYLTKWKKYKQYIELLLIGKISQTAEASAISQNLDVLIPPSLLKIDL